MFQFKTEIHYNNRQITAEIDSASDISIYKKCVAASIALLINLDEELIRTNTQQEHYKLIQAHGNNKKLYELETLIMSKDEASKKYDIINACNPEFWIPAFNSKVKAYALGNINSHELKRHYTLTDIDFKATIIGRGNFIINNKLQRTLNLNGECYQENHDDLIYDIEGIKLLKMRKMQNFSK